MDAEDSTRQLGLRQRQGAQKIGSETIVVNKNAWHALQLMQFLDNESTAICIKVLRRLDPQNVRNIH